MVYNSIIAMQRYFLLLEPIEEMIRERREYFSQKEIEYQIPKGIMNHFWILIKVNNLIAQNKNITPRLIDQKLRYLAFVVAGVKNSYLPIFYNIRFIFTAKGRFNKNKKQFSVFTHEKIVIESLWEKNL